MSRDVSSSPIEPYCLGCRYMLRGIGRTGRCPECGREFDLNDPKTWTPHPRRRIWRFLRWPLYALCTLLILVMCLAGWIEWGYRAEQPAIAWVNRHGYVITTHRIGPDWLHHLAGRWAGRMERVNAILLDVSGPAPADHLLGRLRWLRRAALHGEGMNPQWLDELARLRHVDLYELGQNSVNDSQLRSLMQRITVEQLHMYNSPVTDDGLAALSNHPELTQLWLNDTQVRGPGLTHLKDLPNFVTLFIGGQTITEQTLAAIAQHTRLRNLALTDIAYSGEGLHHLANLQLEILNLFNTSLDDTAIEDLSKLKSLKLLDVRQTRLTPAGAKRLADAMPQTQIFSDHPQGLPEAE